MSNLAPKHSSQKVNHNRYSNHSRLALSARACSAILAGTMLLGGGLTASLAYADGYVDNTGNNVITVSKLMQNMPRLILPLMLSITIPLITPKLVERKA